MNNKNKNFRDLYRGKNEFKKGYRNNLVKDENDDLLADSHNILIGERNTFISYGMYIVSIMLGRQEYM
jgi:hypothetical protein